MKITLLAAALIALIYSAFLQWGPRPSVVRTQSQWQDNRQVLEDYLYRGERASVVLVGSSLSRRLDLEPLGVCVYNLAVAGDSSLTGLQTIVDAGFRPRQVLIEINVPQRATNRKLIDEANSPLKRWLPLLRTENSPINFALGFIYQRRGQSNPEAQTELLFDSALKVQLAAYAKPLPAAVLAPNLSRYAELVTALERRGAQVTFLELPVDASLSQLPFAVQVRSAFRDAFPRSSRVGPDALSGDQVPRTLDGIHLLRADAAALVQRLRPVIMGCNRPNG